MHYLIMIAVDCTPKAFERLEERIESVVMDVTMDGGVRGLATEVVQGKSADTVREAIRSAPKQKAKAPK